ncbi:MAG: potassium/proton antiporter [Proteobacteria bacterium]|nr:potassium/proton antiporter [Pseudomonadota bacterium]
MDFWIFIVGILLFAGVIMGKVSDKAGLPALLLFLTVGMIAGKEGIGLVHFDSGPLARDIGTAALMVILFAGGLDTSIKDIRPVLGPGIVLATVGVVLTTLVLGTFIWFILGTYSTFDIGSRGLGFAEALLLAAIVSSTDAAAVFSVFRSRGVSLRTKIRQLLEFESGSNDPMAVLLTMVVLGTMTGASSSTGSILAHMVLQFVLGGLIGAAVGFAGAFLVSRIAISVSGLYPVLVLSLGMIAFGGTDVIGGNGFLAVYVAGLVIGNRIGADYKVVQSFHDGLSWLCQICMFTVLGLLVNPSELLPAAGVAVVVAFFLMLVARPASVLLCLAPFRLERNELAYVSWVGLRGAIPIILATFPAAHGISGADQIFNVVFFFVIVSVLVQGLSIAPMARWLGLARTNGKK